MKQIVAAFLPVFFSVVLAGFFLSGCQSSSPAPVPVSGAPGAPRAVVSQLPVMRIKSGEEKKVEISARPLTNSGANSAPTFSPDGGKILFISRARASHKQAQVYELDIVRMTERRLTFHDGDDASPAWMNTNEFLYSSSTDKIKEEPAMIARLRGAYLGGSKFEPAQPGDLFRQRVDGREITRLTRSPGLDQDPHRDPASQRIVFVRANGKAQVSLLEGDKARALSLKDANDYQPSFSHDGKKLVFVRSLSAKKSQVYVTDGLDFKTAKAITDDKSMSRDPSWHPTQDAVIFSSNQGGSVFNLYTFDLKLDCLVKLTDSSDNLTEPAFSPDGKNIVFTTDIAGSQHLYMMDYNHGQGSCLRSGN